MLTVICRNLDQQKETDAGINKQIQMFVCKQVTLPSNIHNLCPLYFTNGKEAPQEYGCAQPMIEDDTKEFFDILQIVKQNTKDKEVEKLRADHIEQSKFMLVPIDGLHRLQVCNNISKSDVLPDMESFVVDFFVLKNDYKSE